MKRFTFVPVLFLGLATTAVFADSMPMEIECVIRTSGANLSCQVLGKERKVMTAEDITNFVDAGEIGAFITLKSRKGFTRTYAIDGRAPQYKRLGEIKKSASISEVAKAKSDLFGDIEKKVIKISDEQDGQAAAAELVKPDPSVTFEKAKMEQRSMTSELEGYRKNKDKICTTTPAFENMSKANARLQQTLSNMVYAFQTPDSCMAGFKVFKDKDGTVDLRQLDTAPDHFKANCKAQK